MDDMGTEVRSVCARSWLLCVSVASVDWSAGVLVGEEEEVDSTRGRPPTHIPFITIAIKQATYPFIGAPSFSSGIPRQQQQHPRARSLIPLLPSPSLSRTRASPPVLPPHWTPDPRHRCRYPSRDRAAREHGAGLWAKRKAQSRRRRRRRSGRATGREEATRARFFGTPNRNRDKKGFENRATPRT